MDSIVPSWNLLNIVRCSALLVMGLFSSVALPANAVELSEDDLMIVAVNVGRLQLASDLFIYYRPESTLVPLQAFCDALDFPIDVDASALSASGWFFDESQTSVAGLLDVPRKCFTLWA